MGIVIRQGIYSSIISYVGVIIGYVNLLVLFPIFLDPEQFGLMRTIQDAAILFAPFAQIGLGPAIIRFFPHFSKDNDTAHSFISFVLFVAVVGYGLFLIGFFCFQSSISNYFEEHAAAVLNYTHLVLWLTFILLMMAILEFYGRSMLKVWFPNFLREVLVRLLLALLVTCYFLKIISFDQFLELTVVAYLTSLLMLVIYLIRDGSLRLRFNFSFWNKSKLKAFFSFSLLMLVGNSSMIIIGKVDTLMVSAMLGLNVVAIYTIGIYIATVIEIPKRSLSQLAMPLLAKAYEKNDVNEIHSLYHRTAINQMIIGLLILIGIVANLHNIFQLIPKGDYYQQGIYVVMIFGIGKWIDMTFGPNGEIIILSNYYWISIFLTALLAILVVVSNQLLIPRYGINGAAIGTMAVIVIYNLIKCFVVYRLLKIFPFNRKTLMVILIGGITAFINYLLPPLTHPILDIIFRSVILTFVFGGLILLTRVSDEARRVVQGALEKVGLKGRKH